MAFLIRCGLILGLWCALVPGPQAFGFPLFGNSSNYYSGYYPTYYGSYYPSYYGNYSSYYPSYYGSYYPSYSSSYYPSYSSSYYPSYYGSAYRSYYSAYSPSYYAGYYSPSNYAGNYSPSYYSSYYPAYSSSYYAPSYAVAVAPTYSYSAPVYAAAVPVAVSLAVPCAATPKVSVPSVNTFATPAPAPASQTPEPPTKPPSGTVYGSFYNAALATGTNGKTVATLKVGFWNLTASPVTIQVNGETHVVAVNRSVTLVLPRQFAWHLEQQPPQTENIPADRSSFEIVLR